MKSPSPKNEKNKIIKVKPILDKTPTIKQDKEQETPIIAPNFDYLKTSVKEQQTFNQLNTTETNEAKIDITIEAPTIPKLDETQVIQQDIKQ